jgi:hypothetical protein
MANHLNWSRIADEHGFDGDVTAMLESYLHETGGVIRHVAKKLRVSPHAATCQLQHCGLYQPRYRKRGAKREPQATHESNRCTFEDERSGERCPNRKGPGLRFFCTKHFKELGAFDIWF